MIDNKKIRLILEGFETKMINVFVAMQQRRIMKKYVAHMPSLTSEQKRAVREFWKPYCKVDTDWIRYYSYISGKFDPRYIPDDLQHTIIDQHFNSRKSGYGFNDKNYYSLLFPDIKQPTTVVRKIGGLLFDEDYHLIDWSKAEERLSMRQEVIVKPSQDSGGGKDIRIFAPSSSPRGEGCEPDMEHLKKVLLCKDGVNLIVQNIVQQHSELAKMHPQSLNTIRIYTIMMEDGVHTLSASLKMGANNSRIDNVTQSSGIIAGIKSDGSLMERAYFDMYSGRTTDRHPGGMLLSEIRVPSYDKMIETVKRAAQHIGNFRLVGWDLSVDEAGEVVLIEANMRRVDIGPIQCLHGPFYGSLTERVLNEVF